MTGEEIRTLRKERLGLNQQAFAAKLGISYATVSRIENGLVEPSGSVAILLRQIIEQTKPRRKNAGRTA